MNTFDAPQRLLDRNRLQEIYNLRVFAYEHSHKAKYVNKDIFPDGWKDDLDELENTIHWVLEHEDKIVGAARLAILNDLQQTGDIFDKFNFPAERPFAYWSRLVVHPDYRHGNAMMLLDHVRKNHMHQNPEIAFAICWVTPERKNSVLRLGFSYLGESEYNFGGTAVLPISAYLYIPIR